MEKTLISTGIKSFASLAVYAIKKADSSRANVNARKQADLLRCFILFDQGLQRLLNSLDCLSCESNSEEYSATNVEFTRRHALTRENGELDILAVLDRFCDVFTTEVHLNGMPAKFVSIERFVWAKVSFKAAEADATKAMRNKALSVHNRVLAAKVSLKTIKLLQIQNL